MQSTHPGPTNTPKFDKIKRIAIFGSGGGSNAQAIIDHFENHEQIEVGLIVSNKKDAFILERGKKHDIPTVLRTKKDFKSSEKILEILDEQNIDLIVLAGFLLLIPAYLVKAYPNQIINIHPALLPKFGGKGMYGMNVHRAVAEAKEIKSGPTIHYVNEKFDEGEIIAQFKVALENEDTPESIAKKVLQLEHKHYPEVIEDLLTE